MGSGKLAPQGVQSSDKTTSERKLKPRERNLKTRCIRTNRNSSSIVSADQRQDPA